MAGSGQRMDKEKSGGQRIDDHKFWAGGVDKEVIMPRGAHLKAQADADGCGEMMNYEDTAEKIKGQQELGVRKQKSHPQRPMYRN
jgi:hypothetical protein